LKISSVLGEGTSRNRCDLYVKKFNNKFQTILDACKSILGTQGEQELCIEMRSFFNNVVAVAGQMSLSVNKAYSLLGPDIPFGH
jgi:hypothetical protein